MTAGSLFQSAVGLSITARCPIACAHCIVGAGRHRTDEMPLETAKACLDSCVGAHRRGVESVIVTGGEPFFSPVLLKAVLQHACSLGLLPVVITNGFWAKTEAAALATLRRFPEIGLLTISTDKYHRAFISAAKFRNAAKAARQMSIPVNAAVCVDGEEERGQVVHDLKEIIDVDRIRIVGTLPAGRAEQRPATAQPSALPPPGGPCTGADFPIVFPDGRVIACMGIVEGLRPPHPLLLGNVNQAPLDRLLASADRNVFLHAMRALGPDAIVAALNDDEVDPPVVVAGYGGCSLCYAMAADSRLLGRVLDRLSTRQAGRLVARARLRYLGEHWPETSSITRGETGAARHCS